MGKYIKRVFAALAGAALAVCIIIWGVALIRCEVLTHRYHAEFVHAHESNTMLGEMQCFKVLRRTEAEAEVYCVSKGWTDANVLSFERRNGAWEEVGWNTIWSTTGSASEVIWPYWWHFIYGGF